jgi:hypothetical protein
MNYGHGPPLYFLDIYSVKLHVVFPGTTLNYFLDSRINRAEILFTGVACFLVAVILGSLVHASNAADNEKKLSESTNTYKLG